jgi:putative photosynthetic complex assembly protein
MTGFVSEHSFPRLPLIGAGVLIAFAIGSIAVARLTGFGESHATSPQARIVRDLRFEDRSNGAVAVLDAGSNIEVAELAPGQDGFVRGVLRAFARERRTTQTAITSPNAPFRLSLGGDGLLAIQDMATGRLIALNAFGETNSSAFAALLGARSPAAQVAASKETAR